MSSFLKLLAIRTAQFLAILAVFAVFVALVVQGIRHLGTWQCFAIYIGLFCVVGTYAEWRSDQKRNSSEGGKR